MEGDEEEGDCEAEADDEEDSLLPEFDLALEASPSLEKGTLW